MVVKSADAVLSDLGRRDQQVRLTAGDDTASLLARLGAVDTAQDDLLVGIVSSHVTACMDFATHRAARACARNEVSTFDALREDSQQSSHVDAVAQVDGTTGSIHYAEDDFVQRRRVVSHRCIW